MFIIETEKIKPNSDFVRKNIGLLFLNDIIVNSAVIIMNIISFILLYLSFIPLSQYFFPKYFYIHYI